MRYFALVVFGTMVSTSPALAVVHDGCLCPPYRCVCTKPSIPATGVWECYLIRKPFFCM